uniref:NADH-ubiquinone oxidoreductase chain 6 n=1 Tax=Heterocerus fenestratus TaxID=904166 RepID=I7EGH7_9COLE|nr:NADH dehydrogenase subunit 6 [Heterocerus fenestratus]
MTIPLIFLFLKHPMTMGLALLLQTLTLSMITGSYFSSFWFSYVVFIIMIGGMLVLFIYMTSIASNEIFKFSKLLTLISMIFFPITYVLIPIISKKLPDMYQFNQSYELEMTLNKFFNWPSNLATIMVIIYLLITLIAVVKISSKSQGPLRQMF